MIDWSKPVETTCGLSAKLVYTSPPISPTDASKEYFIHLVLVIDGDDEHAGWCNDSGEEVDEDFSLRNVAE